MSIDGDRMSGSMDCNELEMERGITILSKVTRLEWKGEYNIIIAARGVELSPCYG